MVLRLAEQSSVLVLLCHLLCHFCSPELRYPRAKSAGIHPDPGQLLTKRGRAWQLRNIVSAPCVASLRPLKAQLDLKVDALAPLLDLMKIDIGSI
jgi:hypothetical protein